MMTIREIWKVIIRNYEERFPFVHDWRKNPYTFVKMKFYQATSVILIFHLLKTKIHPNVLTTLYVLGGVVGGVMLAIPTKMTVIIAGLIFFSKGIFDVADGQYARLSGQTSYTGAILDEYGALTGALGLQIGLGFFVAHKSGHLFWYYLIPLIPFFYAANFINYTKKCLIDDGGIPPRVKALRETSQNDKPADARAADNLTKRKGLEQLGGEKLKPLFTLVKILLDNRARSVDLICLILIIEMYHPIFISWLIFILFVAKQGIICALTFFNAVQNFLAEACLERVATEIADLDTH